MNRTAQPVFVYLVGTGGIGMSALARWYMQAGIRVAGYDKTPGAVTKSLEADGMPVIYEDRVNAIPSDFLLPENKEKMWVVFTPAVPTDLSILEFFRSNGYQIKKRAEVLGQISTLHKTFAIAGTHGKTTTSAALTHILKHCGNDCTAFVGGITKNYETNFLFGNSGTMVAEADEFDKSFLKLSPAGAVITSVEADHLDIYGSGKELEKSFIEFASIVKHDGPLVVNSKYAHIFKSLPHSILTYSSHEKSDFFASDIQASNEGIDFNFNFRKGEKIATHLPVFGIHNIENAIAAGALAYESGIAPKDICNALETFTGVVRRFDVRYKNNGQVLIDDYAHHPDELNALANSVKLHFPTKKATIIFQPHLYTRTRDFANGFSSALSRFDQVCLLDIYPARELPIPGITSTMLLKNITSPVKALCERHEVSGFLSDNPSDIIITAGAGDIETLVPELIHWLKEKHEKIS
ncbi:MAG: UDP-N-acetylmuramate--L-alanine ligase [Bacteroidetes bacterium HGW-Bacteroidetes-21]|jgi:UDP-N-acetylmuramate--alanine ligase|nr:MAG: UDP-N-acetylmuramate--L-alanine ligase [Bacteroidetes bacterium HGW-Bacteroidetes-21]